MTTAGQTKLTMWRLDRARTIFPLLILVTPGNSVFPWGVTSVLLHVHSGGAKIIATRVVRANVGGSSSELSSHQLPAVRRQCRRQSISLLISHDDGHTRWINWNSSHVLQQQSTNGSQNIRIFHVVMHLVSSIADTRVGTSAPLSANT